MSPLLNHINKLTEEQRIELKSFYGGGAENKYLHYFQTHQYCIFLRILIECFADSIVYESFSRIKCSCCLITVSYTHLRQCSTCVALLIRGMMI